MKIKNQKFKFFTIVLLFLFFSINLAGANLVANNSIIILNLKEESGYLEDFNEINIKLWSINPVACVVGPCPQAVEIIVDKKGVLTIKPNKFALFEGRSVETYNVNIKLISIKNNTATFNLSNVYKIETIEISPTETTEIITIRCPNNCILSGNTCTCPTGGTCTSYTDNKSCTVVECSDGSGTVTCPKPICDPPCTLSGNTCTCPVGGICTSHVDDKGCTVLECSNGIGSITCPEPKCESPCVLSGNVCTCPVEGTCTVHTDDKGCTVTECTDGTGSITCPEIKCESPCTLSGNTCTCPTTETKPVEVQIETATGVETINIKKVGDKLYITTEKTSAVTTEKLIVEESNLYIKTSVGNKQVKILPEEASSKATEIVIVKKIELKEENTKPIYSVKGTKEARILFLIPVTLEIETKISAETGDVISINKPWWSFLAW